MLPACCPGPAVCRLQPSESERHPILWLLAPSMSIACIRIVPDPLCSYWLTVVHLLVSDLRRPSKGGPRVSVVDIVGLAR